MDNEITVAEVTYCNSISVSEHVVMMILALVRNYILSYQTVIEDGWNIADCVSRSYDVEGMQVGTVGAGRIGSAVLRRMKPFEVGLHYTDRHRLPDDVEKDLGVTFHESTEAMIPVCDVVTINAPLHPETEGLFDEEMLGRMKRGAYIVNTARGKICDRDAIVRALESGQLAGYAGDVWFPQPAPRDHPWRSMPHHGMTRTSPARASRPRPVTRRAPARSSSAGWRGGRSARGIFDRRCRRPGRGGGPLLQRRRCHRRLGGGGEIQLAAEHFCSGPGEPHGLSPQHGDGSRHREPLGAKPQGGRTREGWSVLPACLERRPYYREDNGSSSGASRAVLRRSQQNTSTRNPSGSNAKRA